MKRLLVVYDKNIKDKGRDSYLKAIKREIPTARIIDLKDFYSESIKPLPNQRLLILKPMTKSDYGLSSFSFVNNPFLDIEGVFRGRIPITAEAILRKLFNQHNQNLTDKTIIIVNQSDVLGKPLAKELINLGANVISLNSSFDKVFRLLYFIRPDILISASGSDDFKISGSYLKDIRTIIDLSNDIDYEDKITSIPTIEVLKDRLKWWRKY